MDDIRQICLIKRRDYEKTQAWVSDFDYDTISAR